MSKETAFGLQGTATKETSKSSAFSIIVLSSSSLFLTMNQTETVFRNQALYKSLQIFHISVFSVKIHSTIRFFHSL
nr:MAG TPA: hypothetical protein [Caudoviricetes sp.]